MSELKKSILITSISFIAFIVLIILLKTVDVKDLYDAKEIGLAGLNKTYYKPYNKTVDLISDIIFYLVIAFNVFLIILAAINMAKVKSIKIDAKFYIYFGILALAIILWLVFDKVLEINTRPNIVDGKIEGSFPSTHVFVTTYIMLASPYLFLKMEGNESSKLDLEGVITIIFIVLICAMVALRLYAGVHWITDCIGGVLLGIFLYGLFYLFTNIIKNKKSQE